MSTKKARQINFFSKLITLTFETDTEPASMKKAAMMMRYV